MPQLIRFLSNFQVKKKIEGAGRGADLEQILEHGVHITGMRGGGRKGETEGEGIA